MEAEHRNCPHYLEPPATGAEPPPGTSGGEGAKRRAARNRALRVALWVVVGLAAVAVIYTYGTQVARVAPAPSATPSLPISPTPSATATTTPMVTAPGPTREIEPPTPTATPYPGGAVYVLTPGAGMGGWVASNEPRGNHLGDTYLYTGVFDTVIYHAAFQLDLATVPRGADIYSAVLELTGLNGGRLGTSGTWEVRILEREADEGWSRQTYQDVHNAPVQWSLAPAMGLGDLQAGKVNAFALSSEQIQDLEQRLLDEHYPLSFRIDGPLAGENSVFAWDSGYGPATRGAAPRLVLNVGPAPKTPLPTGTPPFVVVTSTPTPGNVVTAMAWAMTATAAWAGGTPTPTSIYEWTATPVFAVTSQPEPRNQATADWEALVATAIAFTTGTFTPTPIYFATATATPVMIPVGELTPTRIPPGPTPAPPIPRALEGRILYLSNRAGSAGPWAMRSDGGSVALLTASWPYDLLANRDAVSPDGQSVLIAGTVGNQPAVLVRPARGGDGQPIVVFQQGQISSPVWSPTGRRIAFVATGTGGTAVWLANPDGSGLVQLTSTADGSASHPSFSPDGTRLAYALAGVAGRRQVWSIAVDGSDRRNLSSNGWDEWAPVWVK
jgi:hypothetical protein